MQSENINELAAALCKAQMEIQGAKEDSSNPFFKSKYADLFTVWQSCKDQLNKNGLSIAQTFDCEGEKNYLVTTLLHSSGQWLRGKMLLPQIKPGSQELGSCATYCRRYALSAIVGICPYDDDAEEAMKSIREPKKQEIKPNREITNVHKILAQNSVFVSVEEVEAFLDHLVKKYSTPKDPQTRDSFLAKAILKPEDFVSGISRWLDKEKPTS